MKDYERSTALCGLVCAALASFIGAQDEAAPVPAYLKSHEELYRRDPRAAADAWFREAKFGLFVHYGLVSLLPGGKYESRPGDPNQAELKERFTAAKFDADALVKLAEDAGMRYITFTPYHGGGPYLFRSQVAHPNTVDDLPAKRDLVSELAEACRKRGQGLMLYVHASVAQSHEPVRKRNQGIFRELLTQYGPIAGLWFDTDSAYYKDKDRTLYPNLKETCELVRRLQPQCLISFCHGVTGDEDFVTYEHRFHELSEFKFVPEEVRKRLAGKPVEICTTLQLNEAGGKGTKMWFNVEGAYHRNADEVWAVLGEARRDGCNLLLNTGLLGDGSVHPADAETLKQIGRRLKENGFPLTKERRPGTEEEDR